MNWSRRDHGSEPLLVAVPGPRPVAAPAPQPPALVRPVVQPLTADLNRVHLTVSREFLEKLEQARAALSHLKPGAGASEVLEAGLDLVIAAAAKRRSATDQPQKNPRPASPDTLTAEVKRKLWKRDQGCCQWPVDSGGVCGSKDRVEMDHVEARALGAGSELKDLRLLCWFHQELSARLLFGDDLINRYRKPKFTRMNSVDGRGEPTNLRGLEAGRLPAGAIEPVTI